MRKIFTILAVVAAVFCLSSCNLDKTQTFVFSYEARGAIDDETNREAAEKYFEDNYMTPEKAVSFTCKSSEAMEKALALFKKDVQDADDEYILSLIDLEEDFVELTGVLSGDKTRAWVGTRTWTYQEKMGGEGETESTE